MLSLAATQGRHSAPERPVHLDLQQIVAIHTHGPRRVELGDDLALGAREAECGVRRVVRRGWVGPPALIHTLGDVGGARTLDAPHLAEHVVQHVAPVGEHIEDDPAAIFLPIVPRRTLRRVAAPVAPGTR